jgi:hypothetical protein
MFRVHWMWRVFRTWRGLRGSWELSGRNGCTRSRYCRRRGARGLARRRLRRRHVLWASRGLRLNGAGPMRRSGNRGRGRAAAGMGLGDRARRRCGGRRSDCAVVRPVGGGRRGDDDLFGRGRAGTLSGPDRREMHGAGVEEQGHRGRAEEQRDRRRCHSPSDYPDCAPFTAFVGRHRPVLPFPGWASLGLGPEIQETRSDINPGTEPTFAVSGGIISDRAGILRRTGGGPQASAGVG